MGICRKALPRLPPSFKELFIDLLNENWTMRIVLYSKVRDSRPFLSLSCHPLKADVFIVMRKKEYIEDLISSSLIELIERSTTLARKDQIAIYQEFKEWIHGDTEQEDIWFIDRPLK